MALVFAGAAIFRMTDRDDVMNHENGTHSRHCQPFFEPGLVEAGVANVQIDRAGNTLRTGQPGE
ncbi:hypothetical protein NX02_01735 [Sphingomonas sanxanigenens DSM 19645 = NX02]|uniref:Uncharacterized protein n=1 Tax=Sphingomonas sanxanigenens DSM 19645 = NX02 TaxID=1123269 RepID=W0A2F1_9SPHN|nr:hypothetical protein NX02_01735 [Sphingomonas sanxanigenens DSM 19645 = NX02]